MFLAGERLIAMFMQGDVLLSLSLSLRRSLGLVADAVTSNEREAVSMEALLLVGKSICRDHGCGVRPGV